MAEAKNVPRIRFPGFSGEWEQRKLGDVLVGLKNNTFSRAELSDKPGTAKNIHYGDILTQFGEVIDVCKTHLPTITDERTIVKYQDSFLQNGDIIVADTAEDSSVGKCCEIKGLNNELVLSGLHTIPYRPTEKFATGYLGYYMNSDIYHNQLRPLMQGIKVTAISKSAMSDTKICFPSSIAEQTKIADFFADLDALIASHRRELEDVRKLKRAMLQKMFPREGEAYPEVRFPGFTDAWETRKLGDAVERVTRKNENLESTLPLTISAQYGLINQNEFFSKRIASKDVSGYYLVRKGEFAYNKSTSADAQWGAVKRLDRYECGVLSTLYIVFRILDESKMNSDYLATFYNTSLWHKGIQAIASEGARNHGLLNIAPVDFFETSLTFPKNIAEQKKIADFFSTLDSLIALREREIEHLGELKKGLLQQMFCGI